ncbi:hypothetical protein [Cognataquiflexum rubidum]|uniref:hypothetical protein n=1 Tax=Cognataquiflexum rubidum TaxID=2922273 RepID=UPI001F129C6E|nr:hypothetical protein [Cognataquiflexum rubidum]MCH6235258.1 hypothetical protein [Cognataquiflexum rubidum]
MKKVILNSALIILLSTTILSAQNGFKILNQSTNIIEENQTSQVIRGKNVYKTIEIINWNYYDKIKKSKESELNYLKNELYSNSDGSDGNPPFHPDTVKIKSEKTKILEKEIKTLDFKQDSLYHLYTKDYLKFKRINILNFGPVRSGAFFDIIYVDEQKRFKTFTNAGINFSSNTASIFTEIVSGNLGLFRVGFGSMVSGNNNDNREEGKIEEAYQRLVTYGGNTVLNLEYPLIYFHSRNQQYNLISRLIGRGTADLPAFGTTTDKWAGSGSFGIDIYGDASVSNNELRFYFNYNVNKIYGTDVFRDNLGIANANFSFGQLALGIVLLENIKISFIVATFSSEDSLRNKNVVAGGQVVR